MIPNISIVDVLEDKSFFTPLHKDWNKRCSHSRYMAARCNAVILHIPVTDHSTNTSLVPLQEEGIPTDDEERERLPPKQYHQLLYEIPRKERQLPQEVNGDDCL